MFMLFWSWLLIFTVCGCAEWKMSEKKSIFFIAAEQRRNWAISLCWLTFSLVPSFCVWIYRWMKFYSCGSFIVWDFIFKGWLFFQWTFNLEVDFSVALLRFVVNCPLRWSGGRMITSWGHLPYFVVNCNWLKLRSTKNQSVNWININI